MNTSLITAIAPSPGSSPGDGVVCEVVVRAKRGDRDALGSLYKLYAPTVHAVLLMHVSRHDAEDLIQDCFVKVIGSIGSLQDPNCFGPWVLQMARNGVRDLKRASRRWSAVVGRLWRIGEAPGGELPAVDPRAEAMLSMLVELPEAYRETLSLRFIAGLPGPTIAAVTGLSEGSVRVNLHRGMALLRERLGTKSAESAAESGS